MLHFAKCKVVNLNSPRVEETDATKVINNGGFPTDSFPFTRDNIHSLRVFRENVFVMWIYSAVDGYPDSRGSADLRERCINLIKAYKLSRKWFTR